MEISLQLFGGRGVSSGGNTNFVGHSMPNTWKPNSSRTRYDQMAQNEKKDILTKMEIKREMFIIKVHQIMNILMSTIGTKIKKGTGIEHHMNIGKMEVVDGKSKTL